MPVAYHRRRDRDHLLERGHRLFGTSLLDVAKRCVHQDHCRDDESIDGQALLILQRPGDC
jgi:hypothetical protein